MELYKGYVETKDKKCVEKFKDRDDLRTYEQAKDLHEFAGILAEGVVLIDIDDEEQSEILMQMVEDKQLDCKVVQTTRGKHFLFKNDGFEKCGTSKKLACGITADIKIGGHNAYEILKVDGEERFVEWDSEEYQTAPKWLRPVNSKVDFLNLEAGEGRNDTFFKYILTLTNEGFGKDESREVIKLINNYVLPEPLDDDEIETITRDDAFPAETFYEGKVFQHDKFAEFLMNNDHIKRINGQLHIYRNGSYVAGYPYIEAAILKHIRTLKAAHRVEILKYLEIMRVDNERVANASLIAFNNGIYDITTGELSPLDPDVIVTNKIPWDYDPEAYSELADNTLNKLACGDLDIRALLEECVGYCFYRRNELSKAFVLTGDKSNGKSTFLDMVKNVLGQDNYSALDMSELDERFSVATMSGKLANIGDDISDEFLAGKSVSIFKKIVSGNQVKAEYKGQDAFFFNPYVKLLFSANDIPRIRDKAGAVLRRLVIIPFHAKFSRNDPDFDPYITHKLKDEKVMQYLIRLGIEGLRRVLENNSFTESQKVTKEIKDYEIQNNPIMLFIQEHDDHEIVNQETKEVHRMYKVFCAENGFIELTLANFSKEICKRMGLTVKRTRVNGKQVGIYVKG